MSAIPPLTPLRGLALAVLGVPGAAFVVIVATSRGLVPLGIVLGLAAVLVALLLLHAGAAAVQPRAGLGLVRALYAVITICWYTGLVALVEIGARFAAADSGLPNPVNTGAMIATGVVGSLALVALVVLLAVLVRRLVVTGPLRA